MPSKSVLDVLVVADDLGEDARRADVGHIEAGGQGDAFAFGAEEESAVAHDVGTDDQLKAGVGMEARLADEDQPAVQRRLPQQRLHLSGLLP
jgi:hypothetical protein